MARALLYGSPSKPVILKFALSVLQVAVLKIPRESSTLDLVLFIFRETEINQDTLPLLSNILPVLGEQVLMKQSDGN